MSCSSAWLCTNVGLTSTYFTKTNGADFDYDAHAISTASVSGAKIIKLTGQQSFVRLCLTADTSTSSFDENCPDGFMLNIVGDADGTIITKCKGGTAVYFSGATAGDEFELSMSEKHRIRAYHEGAQLGDRCSVDEAFYYAKVFIYKLSDVASVPELEAWSLLPSPPPLPPPSPPPPSSPSSFTLLSEGGCATHAGGELMSVADCEAAASALDGLTWTTTVDFVSYPNNCVFYVPNGGALYNSIGTASCSGTHQCVCWAPGMAPHPPPSPPPPSPPPQPLAPVPSPPPPSQPLTPATPEGDPEEVEEAEEEEEEEEPQSDSDSLTSPDGDLKLPLPALVAIIAVLLALLLLLLCLLWRLRHSRCKQNDGGGRAAAPVGVVPEAITAEGEFPVRIMSDGCPESPPPPPRYVDSVVEVLVTDTDMPFPVAHVSLSDVKGWDQPPPPPTNSPPLTNPPMPPPPAAQEAAAAASCKPATPPPTAAAPPAACQKKKLDGMTMAGYLMPPATTPKVGLGLPFALAASQGRGKRKHKALKKSAFGAPIGEYAFGTCYGHEAPQILLALWCGLVNGGGLFIEGIFRLAADPNECASVEKALAKGRLPQKAHPVVLGHLIKKFLRELPGGLLGCASTEVIQACGGDETTRRSAKDTGGGRCSAEAEARLYGALDATSAASLRWLIRILSITQECEEKNKMSTRNLTLVLAPNLFGPGGGGGSCDNPMEELLRVQVATNALHALVSAEAERAACS